MLGVNINLAILKVSGMRHRLLAPSSLVPILNQHDLVTVGYHIARLSDTQVIAWTSTLCQKTVQELRSPIPSDLVAFTPVQNKREAVVVGGVGRSLEPYSWGLAINWGLAKFHSSAYF